MEYLFQFHDEIILKIATNQIYTFDIEMATHMEKLPLHYYYYYYKTYSMSCNGV